MWFKILFTKIQNYYYENSIYRKHTELAVGKAPKGVFRFKRPDELAATIEFMMNAWFW
jgi:hypothetical protein